ncbi:hypothetical protein Cni_G17152 [Canna indica]|uniref:Uncharacterized protein n=1 Tax=Canna indica TaxID=4628 RepID=A0AAQ3QEU3_9LILI|nr:hypothetical protein Cni_G17152 [Canna indica]
MEGSSSSSSSFSSIGDGLSKRKDANPSARSASSSSSSAGYFSTVIPPASAVISKELSHSDLCWTLNKQRAEARVVNARCSTAEATISLEINMFYEIHGWDLGIARNTNSCVAEMQFFGWDGCISGKSQGSPSKRQITQNKDGKPFYPNDSIESPNFGSSVHYGARDFYTSTSSTQTSETSESYITDGGSLGNPHAADRGEWWQGSLYY